MAKSIETLKDVLLSFLDFTNFNVVTDTSGIIGLDSQQNKVSLLQSLEEFKGTSQIDISHYDELPQLLLLFSHIKIGFQSKPPLKVINSAESLLEFAEIQVYSVNFNEVSKTHLDLYCLSCMVLSMSLCLASSIENKHTCFLEALKKLDLAIIVSGPTPHFKDWIFNMIEYIQYIMSSGNGLPKTPNCKALSSQTNYKVPISNAEGLTSVSYLNSPSLSNFVEHVCKTNQPVILTECLDDWPALSTNSWADVDFLKHRMGLFRTIPIEVGTDYTDDSWSQKLMTVEDFFELYLLPDRDSNNDSVGYLAQHDIFRQFPQLRNDIFIPDYCYALSALPLDSSTENYDNREVLLHGWLGPKGTVTPAHNDPYFNLFAQVVGYKSFLLFPPEQASNLYLHDTTTLLSNTSELKISLKDKSLGVNLEEFPLFSDALKSCKVAHLKPGDLLYIPPKYFHHVESTSVSFGVSFWT